jgi:hypothetical protein
LVVISEGHHLGVTDGWRMEAGKAEREAISRWEHKGGGGGDGIWMGSVACSWVGLA